MEPTSHFGGNPFIGLHPFDQSHTVHFRGRDEVIRQGLDKLQRKAQSKSPFLLLIGKSGVGKSSLVQAGILPSLAGSSQFSEVDQFHTLQIHPCDLGQDPIRALISSLAKLDVIKIIPNDEVSAYTRECKERPNELLSKLKTRLETLPDSHRIVLGISQLERIFISEQIGLATKRLFFDVLGYLVQKCNVFVVASMRSDYYHSLSEYPTLLALKQGGGQLDVTPPSKEQLRQMIFADSEQLHYEPAKANMPDFDDYLVQRAIDFPGSLPLLQFLMMHLYANRSQSGMINYATYKKLGGLERVVARVTEQAYESLERSAKRYFSRTVNRLAEKSQRGHYERLWVNQLDLEKNTNAEKLLNTFLEIGVFVQYQSDDGTSYLSLAHDCLFEHWPRLIETLDSRQRVHALKQVLETQASEWKSATRPSMYLLSSGKALEEGKLILKQGGSISPKLKGLIDASIRRVALRRRLWVGGSVVAAMAFGFALNNTYQAKVSQQIAEQELAKSQQLIEFLIDEESKQLEKIGRLELMRTGSKRSMDYLKDLEPIDDSTAAISSRSRVFFQIGQVYLENNEYPEAIEAFERALALDNELVEIHPSGFNYLHELAKGQFAIGKTYLEAGDREKAEQFFLAYQKTAFDLVDLQPDSATAKLELSKAFAFLASIADQREQMESATQFHFESVKFAEKSRSVATIDDLNRSADSYQWLVNKYLQNLKVAEAIEMSKGEVRIRQQISQRENSEEHQLAYAKSNWQLANTLLLVGQHKQASNVLEELITLSENALANNQQQDIWRNIAAFSLSQLAQLDLHGNNLEEANDKFVKSFAQLDAMANLVEPNWYDAFYERQYWYSRLQNKLGNRAAFDSASSVLRKSAHQQANPWQLRLDSLEMRATEQQNYDLDTQLTATNLIAHLEHASTFEKFDYLAGVSQRVPQEMWLNADLEALRPKIRLQIN